MRCPDGFEVTCVPCPSGCCEHAKRPGKCEACAPAAKPQRPPPVLKLAFGEPRGPDKFIDMVGFEVAGARVLKRANVTCDAAYWVCLLRCGHHKTIKGSELRSGVLDDGIRCAVCAQIERAAAKAVAING